MYGGSDLRWKIFGGISVAGCVLLFLLGYNLGTLNEDARATSIQHSLDKAYRLGRERLGRCLDGANKMNKGIQKTSSDMYILDSDIERLDMERQALVDSDTELKEDIESCQKLVTRYESSGQNLTRQIEDIKSKILELELTLTKSTTSKAQQVKIMKGEIRALRLENEAMRIRKLQREMLISSKKKEVEEYNKQKEKDAEKARELEDKIKESQEYLVHEIDSTANEVDEEKPVKRATRVVRVDEDDEVAPPPRRKKRVYVDEDDDVVVRPRRRRSHDDEQEYETRRSDTKYSDINKVPLPRSRRAAEEEPDEVRELPRKSRRAVETDEEADARSS